MQNRMKTFRELISWELEQEKKQAHSLVSTEDGAGKLGACALRKIRYLSAATMASPKGNASGMKPAW